jgi:membrane associated rhomboid family serine protease
MSDSSPYQSEPVCPRHPDRVAYVRCQRCGQPTCPECQRPAAVGIQCVDCVREGQKSTRMPRTQFGAKVSSGGRPAVTLAIIVICVVVWLLQQVSPQVTSDLQFSPVLGATQPWRFLTVAFVHSPGQVLHILLNMYALWVFGQYLEPMLGRVRFAALYLISAFGGSVGYLMLAAPPLTVAGVTNSSWVTPMVGASGAIFGLFGALFVLNRHLGRSSGAMFVVLAVNAVLGFVVPGIAWQAHLGGLLTGVALAAAITTTAPQVRRRFQLPSLAAVLVLLAVAATAKYALTDDSFVRSIVSLGAGAVGF